MAKEKKKYNVPPEERERRRERMKKLNAEKRTKAKDSPPVEVEVKDGVVVDPDPRQSTLDWLFD